MNTEKGGVVTIQPPHYYADNQGYYGGNNPGPNVGYGVNNPGPNVGYGVNNPGPNVGYNNTVIVTQNQGERVPDMLGLAIFVTVCCCLPIGIAAIVFASNSRSAVHSNDSVRARKDAEISKKLSISGIVIGIVCSSLIGILYYFVFSAYGAYSYHVTYG